MDMLNGLAGLSGLTSQNEQYQQAQASPGLSPGLAPASPGLTQEVPAVQPTTADMFWQEVEKQVMGDLYE